MGGGNKSQSNTWSEKTEDRNDGRAKEVAVEATETQQSIIDAFATEGNPEESTPTDDGSGGQTEQGTETAPGGGPLPAFLEAMRDLDRDEHDEQADRSEQDTENSTADTGDKEQSDTSSESEPSPITGSTGGVVGGRGGVGPTQSSTDGPVPTDRGDDGTIESKVDSEPVADDSESHGQNPEVPRSSRDGPKWRQSTVDEYGGFSDADRRNWKQ